MSCGSGNITVRRNGFIRESFLFEDDAGATLDFTGWHVRMQVRPTPGADDPALLDLNDLTPTANASLLTFTDPGTLEVYVSNNDILTLPEGATADDPWIGAFDIVLTDTGGDGEPYISGSFVVVEGVTR